MSGHDDPYRAPTAEMRDELVPAHLRMPAGPWRRLANFVVDFTCIYALGIGVGVVLALTLDAQQIEWLLSMPNIILDVILYFAYYLAFESLFARTPGKWITGTEVIDETGRRPSFGQMLGRTAARLIPFEFFSFIGDGVGIHDTVARTRVVRVGRTP